MVKYNIGLKTLLQHGIAEPVCMVIYFISSKKVVGKPSFSDQFKI